MHNKVPSIHHARTIKTIDYIDPALFCQLFARSIFLVPLWAILLLPIVGYVCRSMGSVYNQVGLGIFLVWGLFFYLEGLLKLKIRIDDQYLYFGYRAIRLADLASIDVAYKRRSMLPEKLLLTTKQGALLKLNLAGLSQQGVETLVKHVQARNSTLNTAPVITTLVKCTRVVPKPQVESEEKLVLRYSSRQLLEDSFETFRLTATKWLRMGPILICAALAPVWMIGVSALYGCLQASSFDQIQNLNLNSFYARAIAGAQGAIIDSVQESAKGAITTNTDLAVMYGALALLGAIFSYILYLVWKANIVVADNQGISFQWQSGFTSISMGKVLWSEIVHATLYKPGSVETWKIRLKKQDGADFDIRLSGIAPEDRSKLLKRMERLIPNCEIDSELSQAMLPRAERSYTELWLQSLAQAPERKTLDPLEPGKTIGEERFEVLKVLGVGGQGTAYLARNLIDSKSETVVLKETILPVFVDVGVRRNALERFEQEAKLLKSIDDDGIVKLVDYFIEDHRAYLVLEHIDGCTLRELILRDGALSEDRVHDLALQMCHLLSVLHSNNTIHRDFTPDNLILNSKGKLKLIDFNVAQQIQEGSTGTIVGKHAYVPPEQFRGKAVLQSDLYAFGATLHYLLTGADPEPISVSSPRSKNESVSAAMDEVVKRATALQTNKRYLSATEIERDLIAVDAHKLDESSTLSVKIHKRQGVMENG